MVGTAEIITLANDVLASLHEPYLPRHYEPPQGVPRRSLEAVLNFVQQGHLRTYASRFFPATTIQVSERDFSEDKRLQEESNGKWFYESKYWDKTRNCPMEILIDMRESKDIWHPGNGYVTLLDRAHPKRIANEVEEYLSDPTTIPKVLKADFDMAAERLAFLRRIYHKPEVMRFVGDNYGRDEANQIFEALFNAEERFTHMDAAFGRDAALAYLGNKYEQRHVSDILLCTLSPQEYFDAMAHLYPEGAEKERVDVPYVPAASGTATPARQYEMDRHR